MGVVNEREPQLLITDLKSAVTRWAGIQLPKTM